MKKIHVPVCTGRKEILFNPFIYFLIIVAGTLFTVGQKKDLTSERKDQPAQMEAQKVNATLNSVSLCEKAVKDGYKDMVVDVVDNKGHHYLNQSLLNETPHQRHVEMLIYNLDGKIVRQLVVME